MVEAKSSPIIILSAYSKTLRIGDSFFLFAVSSSGNYPSYKSSKSSVASVDADGEVTAKAAGTCKIAVKDSSTTVYCRINVLKTTISLNKKSVSMENGACFRLYATTSNGSKAAFKTNKSSVATVDEYGNITANKPGNAVITATADKSTARCYVTVKEPTIKLSKTSLTLYRGQSQQLTATVSSGLPPTWKSSKSSVATVDESGNITAWKHGTTIISAKVNGITKFCEVTVASPSIKLSCTELTLKVGGSKKITAAVSSGNTPEWTSSKSSVAEVSQNGTVTALKKGTAVISVKEDGTKETCKVTVQ